MNLAPYTIHHGDSLAILATLADNSVDAVITDPPYSSGGLMRGDRALDPRIKYQHGDTIKEYPDFSGDNRDQRSWTLWCVLWLSEIQRVLKPGGYCLVFTDWRQLPATTDALQAGGIVWRGIIPWDKTEAARAPHTGYFRHQCEYVVWGTNGPLGRADGRGPFRGFNYVAPPRSGALRRYRPRAVPASVRAPVRHQEKKHITAKPVALLEQLVKCCPPGGVILDPFMGSATAGQAAIRGGYHFIGIEKAAAYVEISRATLEAEARELAARRLEADSTAIAGRLARLAARRTLQESKA